MTKPTIEEQYPNLVALSQGCVSGRISEWPRLQPEAKLAVASLRELAAIKNQPVPVEPEWVKETRKDLNDGIRPNAYIKQAYHDYIALLSQLQEAQQEADNQFKYAGRLLEQTYELETALKAAQQERDDAQSFNDDQRQLCGFYQVSSKDELINAQAHHIEKLQSKLPPLKDEHPWNYRQG